MLCQVRGIWKHGCYIFTGKRIQISVRRAVRNAWSANQALQASSHKLREGYRSPILPSDDMTKPLYTRISGLSMFRRRVLQLQSLFPSCPSSNTMRLHCVDLGASIVVDRAFGFSHTQRHRAIILWRRRRTCTGLHMLLRSSAGPLCTGVTGSLAASVVEFFERQRMLVHSTASTNFGRSLPVPLIRFNIRFEVPTVDSQCHFTRPPSPVSILATSQPGWPGAAAKANNSGLTGLSWVVGK